MSAKIAAAVVFTIVQLLRVGDVDGAASKRGGLCNVFDPFRVQPDNAKYQIGGPFPLHDSDCIWLRPETVQEIVAIQWALTHWNQNPENAGFKLGLHAGDTCSRPKEAISQTLRFLDTVGYYEPFECTAPPPVANRPKLLGLIAPTDRLSAEALATLLNTARLPVAAYSTVAADALTDAGIKNVLSSAPSIDTYLQTFTSLMSHFESNLVTLVYSPAHVRSIDRIIAQLRNASIFVAETTEIKAPELGDIIAKSDADIVLSLLDRNELVSALALDGVQTLNKLWVNVPANGYGLNADEQKTVLSKGAHLQLVSIQPRLKDLPQFREYFLGVLQSNYQSYSLLTSYVQQVFNCSLIGTPGFTSCEDLDRDHMASMFEQAPGVESVVRTTYALATIGSHFEKNRADRLACDRPNDECTEIIVNAMKELKYNFGTYDPAEFTGEQLTFSSTPTSLLLADGIHIEGIHFFNDEKFGLIVNKIIEHSTGKAPRIVRETFRTKSTPFVKSKCPSYRPYCAACEQTVQVDTKKYFLSIPKQYQVYLLGLFDLHQGNSCQELANVSDISLPMALIHTIWTFRQRYPQLNLLHNVDLGALLVDSCSSGRQAVEVVSRSENDCLRVSLNPGNVTLVPGSVFGYASAMGVNQHSAMKSLFTSKEASAPLIGVDANRSPLINEFSAYPSTQSQAIAVLRFLNAMEWDFVTIVLSDRDAESVNSFGEFEAAAADYGICVAQVVKVRDGTAPSIDPITNATVVFATARDTAAYFAALARSHGVHVLVGDAHDWHLFEATDRRSFAGTVSIQPKDVLYGDFRQWLEMATPKTFPERWFWRYVEEQFKCALTPESTRTYRGKLCSGDELVDVSKLGRLTKSGYLARGIERFLFAMDAVYKRNCPEQTGVCEQFFTNGRAEIVSILKTTLIEDDFDIMNLRPGDDGKIDYYKIGNWSSETGLKFSEPYRSYDASGREIKTIKSTCRPPLCKCNLDADFFTKPLQAAGSFVAREQNPRNFEPFEPEAESALEQLVSGQWRNQPWNYVFLVLITLLLIAAIAVLILVSVKMYLRVVKGNQSLGICLLLGVIMLYATAYLFVLDASDVLCRCRLFFHSLAYTICFGVMIAKATQLRNAETLGFANSTHISYWNYWLLLFFIIAAQLALSLQWLVGRDSSTILIEGDRMSLMCAWGAYDFLWSQVYVILLMLMALFVASLNRNIKRNYKETKWLFSAALFCVPIWASWMVGYALVPLPFKNTVVVVELLACATVLLCFLFGPKLYILLSYEPVLIEYPPPTSAASALHSSGKENPTAALRYDLFERDEDEPINRAVSPASSTGASTHSTALSQATSSSSGGGGGDQSPMFKAVARRKSRSKRAKEQRDSVARRYPLATVHGAASTRLP